MMGVGVSTHRPAGALLMFLNILTSHPHPKLSNFKVFIHFGPFCHLFRRRLDVYTTYFPVRLFTEDSEHGQLRGEGLPGSGGSSKKNIVIRVIETVEYLCLDCVKVLKGVDGLQDFFSQGFYRQRPEIQEI